MASETSTTITVRVPVGTKVALDDAAEEAEVTPSTLAARFIAEGLGRPLPGPPAPVDGPVVAATRGAFVAVGGPMAAVQRETAVALARLVEAGGPGAAGAASRLSELIGRDAMPDALKAFLAHMATPVHTHCQACGVAYPGTAETTQED